jgi:hypothetical protein
LCVILTGLFSMPLGVIQFVFFYHIPHDTYGIHTEVVVCVMIMVYVLMVWRSDRNPALNTRDDSTAHDNVSKKQKGRFIVLKYFIKIEHSFSDLFIYSSSIHSPIHFGPSSIHFGPSFIHSFIHSYIHSYFYVPVLCFTM